MAYDELHCSYCVRCYMWVHYRMIPMMLPFIFFHLVGLTTTHLERGGRTLKTAVLSRYWTVHRCLWGPREFGFSVSIFDTQHRITTNDRLYIATLTHTKTWSMAIKRMQPRIQSTLICSHPCGTKERHRHSIGIDIGIYAHQRSWPLYFDGDAWMLISPQMYSHIPDTLHALRAPVFVF